MTQAPMSAPDWVKKAWVPMPKMHYTDPGAAAYKVIDCNPHGEILFLGGPMHNKVWAFPPESYFPSKYEVSAHYGAACEYVLQKETYGAGNTLYKRVVYIFSHNSHYEEAYKMDTTSWKTAHQDMILVDIKNFKKELMKPKSGEMAFTLKNVDPKMLEILYGKAAELDSWPSHEPEPEDDEPALWEQL